MPSEGKGIASQSLRKHFFQAMAVQGFYENITSGFSAFHTELLSSVGSTKALMKGTLNCATMLFELIDSETAIEHQAMGE